MVMVDLEIIEKHSNFINFNINLNGDVINAVKALWTLPKNDISPEQHTEFYKFISGAFDEPMYNMHFVTDTPLSLKSLLYFPRSHTEKV
jgi:TNF receptor-associated protein 1